MDTAKLSAAVETLQLYCEQVRHVMVAKGYVGASAHFDVGLYKDGERRSQLWLHYNAEVADSRCKSFAGDDALALALAHAESLPPAYTPETIAATLGITPDGRVIEQVEG